MAKIPPEAFCFYQSLGPKRSYAKVAGHYGVSKRAVTRRAARDHWQERLPELEREAREVANEQALSDPVAAKERHLKAARLIQLKALERLKASMSLDSWYAAASALELGVRLERLILGEPTERIAVIVENTIEQRHERRLISAGSEDPSMAGTEKA